MEYQKLPSKAKRLWTTRQAASAEETSYAGMLYVSLNGCSPWHDFGSTEARRLNTAGKAWCWKPKEKLRKYRRLWLHGRTQVWIGQY
ncbi:MAG: hypothetical protein ACUVQY_05860 [Thermoproteota archaeon]